MALFGKSRKEAWKKVAEEMGFQLVEGGFFKTDKIIGTLYRIAENTRDFSRADESASVLA